QTVNSYHWRPNTGGRETGGIGTGGKEQVLQTSPVEILPVPLPPVSLPPVNDFADLLRAVSAVPGVERIRFMSPHPKHMKDRVIQAMAESKNVCRHIHLPLQSGSSRLLTEMKRLYTRDDYLAIVRKLRSAMPDILITTDIIVGY